MMNKKNLFLLSLGVLVVLITVLFHYLPALINPEHSVRQAHFKISWSYQTKKQIISSILVQDMVILGTDKGYLQAISAVDGHPLWSLKFPFAIFSLSSDTKGTIYAGTGLHDSKIAFLSAVNSTNGKMIWQQHFAGHLEEPPALDEEHHRLWAGLGPEGLWALDTRNGKVLWRKNVGHLDGTPLLYQDVLYIPAQKSEMLHESFFYALRHSDGGILWKLDLPGQPWASPQMDKTGRIVLTTTGDGQIGLVRPTDRGWAQGISLDGRLLWQSVLPDMAPTPHVYIPEHDLMIYVTKRGKITALNAYDGSRVWETQVAQNFSAPGALVTQFKEKLIAVTSDDGVLFLVDVHNGTVLFKSKIALSSSVAPLVHRGVIYITTSYGVTALSEMK